MKQMSITNRIVFTESKLNLPPVSHLKKYFKERKAIEENYDFFNCKITSNGLICNGIFKVPDTSKYEVEIKYLIPQHPKVFIVDPKISYNPEIHMYKGGSLCLYYPKDNSWNINCLLYNTIIPWISEWLIFYEIYKIKGEWLGDFKSHEF